MVHLHCLQFLLGVFFIMSSSCPNNLVNILYLSSLLSFCSYCNDSCNVILNSWAMTTSYCFNWAWTVIMIHSLVSVKGSLFDPLKPLVALCLHHYWQTGFTFYGPWIPVFNWFFWVLKILYGFSSLLLIKFIFFVYGNLSFVSWRLYI